MAGTESRPRIRIPDTPPSPPLTPSQNPIRTPFLPQPPGAQ